MSMEPDPLLSKNHIIPRMVSPVQMGPIDVVVTDHGVAVNPRRSDLASRLAADGLPIRDIIDLKSMAEETASIPQHAKAGDKIVAVVEYRDGTIIDVVRQTVG